MLKVVHELFDPNLKPITAIQPSTKGKRIIQKARSNMLRKAPGATTTKAKTL